MAVVAPVIVRTCPVVIMGALPALFRTTVELLMVAFPVRLTEMSFGADALPKFCTAPC